MKLAKYRHTSGEVGVAVWEDDDILIPLDLSGRQYSCLADILEEDEPTEAVQILMNRTKQLHLNDVEFLPPVDQQEVWAAGVTYLRSQTARMEESEAAASCYDRVYQSPRPELFFKATARRVVGQGKRLRIRKDSQWNVPEPELTLVINSRMKLVGFTIGNDMSSRDIEGENPLYLPQAKMYDESCGIGPCITLADAMPEPASIEIYLQVFRDGTAVYDGKTNAGQMARTFQELIDWLARDNTFPDGVMLLTGTGIVPDSDFTLRAEDIVSISIEGIGTLSNPIVQG